jgi:hypothetical protein
MRTTRRLVAIAPALLLALAAPAAAQPVAGIYDAKFEEMSTNCDPVRFTYTTSTVRVDAVKNSLKVNIETIPQMVGIPAKSGKINAKTPKKLATTIQGIDGKYHVSGRVDDTGVLELVLVAEFTRSDNGKPLCTQSWNLRGVRQGGSSDGKSQGKAQKKSALDLSLPGVSESSGSAGARSTP